MAKFFLYLLMIAGSGVMIKFRQQIGDSIGEAEWMRYFGGVYNFIVVLGVLLFFWAIALMTGTVDILFAPIFWIIGGALQ